MQEATAALAGVLRHVEVGSLREDFPTTAPPTVVPSGPCARIVRRRARAALWLSLKAER
jgi:hypothetical protein